jgi:hypothetical protein
MGKLDVILLSLLIIPVLGSAIASYIIASNNQDSFCDKNNFVSLSAWLYINATFSLIFLTGFLLYSFVLRKYLRYTYIPILGLIIGFVFMTILNIIGSIALFEDSSSCQTLDQQLYYCTLVCLILEWLLYFASIIWLCVLCLFLCCLGHHC